MSTLATSSLKMNHQRSSSCSDFALRILNNEQSPSSKLSKANTPQRKITVLQNSFDSNESYETPALSKTRSTFDHYDAPRLFSYRSARPSTMNLSPKSGVFEDHILTPEMPIDLDFFAQQDDEEVNAKELLAPKESDFEISINMVINEIIASSNASVSYPCYMSIKPKEEYVAEKLSVDLTIILDIKNHELSSLSNTLDKFLCQLTEKDRLSLFSTQNIQIKRFPLRRMEESAKTQFINEFNVLANSDLSKHNLSVIQVLKGAINSLNNRKYKNHISAIFLLTDRTREIDFSSVIETEIKENLEEPPLLFTFGIGQKQNSIGLQEACEAFEGKYYHVESTEALNEVLVQCFLELSYIRLKNIRMSLEIESDNKDNGNGMLKIAKVYEKKTLIEESTGRVEAHTNYFSMKEGIDVALEIEVSKCRAPLNDPVAPYSISLAFVGDVLTQNSQISLNQQKALNISRMHPFMRMMPKKIDKKALESFYRVKAAKIVSYSVRMANDGYLKQSLQSLNNLKKELYTFTMLRSEALQKMMKTIECTLNNLQSRTLRSKEKTQHALGGFNTSIIMVGI